MSWLVRSGLHVFRFGLTLGLLFLSDAHRAVGSEAPLPVASEVVRRLIDRAQCVARGEVGAQHTYNKRAVLEEQDSRGRCLKSEEKLYRVTLLNGYPFNRLVKIQGRELNAEELKKEQQREERFRQRFISSNSQKMASRREAWISTNLVDRFEVSIQDRIVFSNRTTLVLQFHPKPGKAQSKSIQDQILNKISATVWMDEADAEPARVEASLQEPVSFGLFGILGSLGQCRFVLERHRLSDGVWINLKQQLALQFRKLATTRQFKQLEESSGFE